MSESSAGVDSTSPVPSGLGQDNSVIRYPGLAAAGLWVALSFGVVLSAPPAAAAPPNDALRDQYRAAETELRSGAGPRYQALRSALEDYPLAIYLDYDLLKGQLARTTPAEARAWLERAEGSPLAGRFRAAWIENHGRRQRWQALLAVQPDEPNDTELQCYYWRARLAQGDREAAWVASARLWNVGVSQHRACDPLFNAWMGSEGPPSDALVWSRALKAFDARSAQLLPYLTRFASPSLVPLLQELYSVYRYPDRLLKDPHQPDPRHAQLMTVGIRRLARVNPEWGLEALEKARGVQPFTDQQLQVMESMIARHSLFAQSAAPNQWLTETLDRLRDDELSEIYLRNCIKAGDWPALLAGLDWLSPGRAGSDEWRYWRARALQAEGQTDAAEQLFREVARERSYHGFLAADQVTLDYQLNRALPPLPAVAIDDPGLDRVRELLALDRTADARAEWLLLLLRQPAEQQVALAALAADAGWQSFAIMAVNTAQYWDALDWRFPWMYESVFQHHASALGVAPGELIAIARRESALYPAAVSPVGAMGLMQLMPGTARQVARQEGMPYRRADLLDPDYNIALGARYYRDLRNRFSSLRPLALAAYNAGPHRIDRWTEGGLDVDQWIDTLPFRETREYVQAVLAYAVIYQLHSGGAPQLLSAEERSHRY